MKADHFIKMNEKGMALMLTVGILLLATLIGAAVLRESLNEIRLAGARKDMVQARYLAESGIEFWSQWFQDPGAFPTFGLFMEGPNPFPRSEFLKPRRTDRRGVPSFFDSEGESQFSGTEEHPDFIFDADSEGQKPWGMDVLKIGGLGRLSLSGPRRPGGLATAEATGVTVSGVRQSIRVEFVPGPVPPVSAAVQTGPGSPPNPPVRLHGGVLRGPGRGEYGPDEWDTDLLRTLARNRGRYFGSDPDGYLYREGKKDPVNRITVSEMLSEIREGLVFIDTVDGRPPGESNLAVLDFPLGYASGVFSVLGHVRLRAVAPGRPTPISAPVIEAIGDGSAAAPDIHFKGILSIAGRLTLEGTPRLVGALIARGGIFGPGEAEVWFDPDLSEGYYPGLPVATIRRGSWQIGE